MDPDELLVRSIEILSPRQPLDFWKVGDRVEGDEMEHDQVRLHHGTHWLNFHVPIGQVVPSLE